MEGRLATAQGSPAADRTSTDRVDGRVLTALRAVQRVAYELVTPRALGDLSEGALRQMRETLGLAVAAMYVADVDPSAAPRDRDAVRLRRYTASTEGGSALQPRAEILVDREAWAMLSSAGAPLVFREAAAWLIANPFDPPAQSWMVLPLRADGEAMGVVIGAASEPIALDPVGALTLTSLVDLLSAGIETARLRMEVQRTAVQRERMRLAADLHDGLAQDLALAVRELSLLESAPAAHVAEASRARLREAVRSAHRVVRAGLEDLSVVVPVGGVAPAVEELCARFAQRGMAVDVETVGPHPDVQPEVVSAVLRVTQEALTNVERHARATRARVRLAVESNVLRLEISDDGRGVGRDVPQAPGDGHFGVWIMRERARAVGGEVELGSRAGGGTTVTLTVPLQPQAGTRGG
jgi:signal transduction histidine kinase